MKPEFLFRGVNGGRVRGLQIGVESIEQRGDESRLQAPGNPAASERVEGFVQAREGEARIAG